MKKLLLIIAICFYNSISLSHLKKTYDYKKIMNGSAVLVLGTCLYGYSTAQLYKAEYYHEKMVAQYTQKKPTPTILRFAYLCGKRSKKHCFASLGLVTLSTVCYSVGLELFFSGLKK
jgi:hypothetical protein